MARYKSESLLLIFSAVLFLDRIFKSYLNDSCISIFCIKRATNYGAAFGMLPGQTEIFIIVSAIVIGLIIYFWKTEKIRLALTFIAAGTIGNLIDRIAYGKIVDIFSIAGSSSFNLADISNLAGAILLVIFILKQEKK
jgi:signal peptidase II